MSAKEARIWEVGLQVWAVLFCLALLRLSPLIDRLLPYGAAIDPLAGIAACWVIAGLLSFAFLCRMRALGQLEDLDRRTLTLSIAASIPLGMASLIHTLDQMRRRRLGL
jgi:hypothetical protein